MATHDMSEDESGAVPSAEMVGNAFVDQYYCTLYQSPEEVHRFYNDSSILTRPGPDGVISSVTTLQAINDRILSLDNVNYKAEILTADSEFSYQGGVMVLVTGFLTGDNNYRRKFTQSFFLAPQEKGYFVLNDFFRHVGESETDDQADSVANNHITESASKAVALTPGSAEPSHCSDHPEPNQTTHVEDDTHEHKDDSQQLSNGQVSVSEKGIDHEKHSIDHSNQSAESPLTETAPTVQEGAPKKSFASVSCEGSPFQSTHRSRASVAPDQASAASSNSTSEIVNDHAVKTYAIFLPNLPMHATAEQLEVVFKTFGPIKHDGIQVRSSKGSCFGFVEYESASSMQSAMQASPIFMFDRKLHIEERRANNDRGKFPSGRGGFRNDNFRIRGNYRGGSFGGGRGYGRNDFEKIRGDF
ncbi:nuclear transport factor 2-like [Juglans microcarpa x Juglans regia]|uniref:nuclear transport factor 2-like n=1 Tax=Juglans microcarpa x Juglans regia TaxID=2249226 RepID=UPI001B7EF0A4|nr:nuclear transport factor 2-like [Juglans microcarpa x Juglans regia]